MEPTPINTPQSSFLGTGWSFPPEFDGTTGNVAMTSDADDVHASLKILFDTSAGERLFHPKYGLSMKDMIFEPMDTTTTTFLKDRIKRAILIFEPRINVLSLELDTSGQFEGVVAIHLDYELKTTNSRFNLVHPFYLFDGSEVRSALEGAV